MGCGSAKVSPEAVSSAPTFKSHSLYIFARGANKQNVLLHFDAKSEEWEALTPEHDRPFLENSQAIQIDHENVLITGGKNTMDTRKKLVDDDEGSVFCELYNTKLKKFFELPQLSTGRYSHCMAIVNKNAYVMGGIFDEKQPNGSGITSSVEKINLTFFKDKLKNMIAGKETLNPVLVDSNNKDTHWIEIEPFLKYRHSANCFVFKGSIMLIGGIQRNGKICRYIEQYLPETNQWTQVKWKLPVALHSFTITGLNSNEILLIGGKNDAGITPSIYQMDFENNKYQSRGAFSFRVNPKVIHNDEDIYIFGGDSEKSCEKLNPEKFISYAASESYTSFFDDDLVKFPASQTCVNIQGNGKKQSSNADVFSNVDIKFLNFNEDPKSFYLFGTPNHPFILELDAYRESTTFYPISMDFRFYYFGLALRLSEEFILSLGGITPPKKLSSKSVQIFHTKTLSSKRLAKMKVGRCKFSGIMHRNLVYVIGGLGFNEGKEDHLKSVEVFDVKKNEWQSLADMETQRYNCGVCASGDKIYVFGGSNGSQYLQSIETYSISENSWTVFNIGEFSLTKELSYLSLLQINSEEVLMVGGATVEDSLKDINIINLREKTITKRGDLALPRQGVKYLKTRECVILIGGSKSGDGIECLKTNTWGLLKDKFLVFDEYLAKYYRDKQLNGIQGA